MSSSLFRMLLTCFVASCTGWASGAEPERDAPPVLPDRVASAAAVAAPLPRTWLPSLQGTWTDVSPVGVEAFDLVQVHSGSGGGRGGGSGSVAGACMRKPRKACAQVSCEPCPDFLCRD